MPIIKWRPRKEWDPFADLLDLHRDINRLFGLSLSKSSLPVETAFAPSVDIVKEDDKYLLRAELPGIKKDEVEITVRDNVITLKGSKKKETEVKEENYYCLERCYGDFQRSFELPGEIDASKVKAAYKDGVLEVELPLSEAAKPKLVKIDVK